MVEYFFFVSVFTYHSSGSLLRFTFSTKPRTWGNLHYSITGWKWKQNKYYQFERKIYFLYKLIQIYFTLSIHQKDFIASSFVLQFYDAKNCTKTAFSSLQLLDSLSRLNNFEMFWKLKLHTLMWRATHRALKYDSHKRFFNRSFACESFTYLGHVRASSKKVV